MNLLSPACDVLVVVLKFRCISFVLSSLRLHLMTAQLVELRQALDGSLHKINAKRLKVVYITVPQWHSAVTLLQFERSFSVSQDKPRLWFCFALWPIYSYN